jgi:hypothetical protein
MGDKLDEHAGQLVQPSGFVVEAMDMHYYAASQTRLDSGARRRALEINFVNPADDPSKTQH